jgi:methionyl-tRNA formyltransferase
MSSPVKRRAVEMGLPIYQPERIRDAEALTRIGEAAPDLAIVVAYGQILPSSVITLPRLGTLNVHASLLPRHRGAAPVAWAILAGDTETGVTIMQMDAGLDTGPILTQARVRIDPTATTAPLEAELSEIGARLLVETIDALDHGGLTPVPQPATGATYAPRLRAEDGKLTLTMSAEMIDRRVRALGRHPGCWLTLPAGRIKVLRGHRPRGSAAGPDAIAVEAADGPYILDEVQPAGGRPMDAAAWARGRR